MKFRPLHDRVVVKRVEEEGKTKGGIIIPDTAKEKPMEGEIVAVGPGAGKGEEQPSRGDRPGIERGFARGGRRAKPRPQIVLPCPG